MNIFLQFAFDMVEGSGASGQLLKAAMAFACHNMAALLEARALDDLSDDCCRQISRFYNEEMGISGRRSVITMVSNSLLFPTPYIKLFSQFPLY